VRKIHCQSADPQNAADLSQRERVRSPHVSDTGSRRVHVVGHFLLWVISMYRGLATSSARTQVYSVDDHDPRSRDEREYNL